MKRIFLIITLCLYLLSESDAQILVSKSCTGPNCYPTIQEAVDASNQFGQIITVMPGTYEENILITKSLYLQSAGGPGSTFIKGIGPDEYMAPIMIQAPIEGLVENVIIGGSPGHGFTIIGIDNITAGQEAAAIIIGRNNQLPFGLIRDVVINHNTITAAGEAGILTFDNGNINMPYLSNLTIDRNLFNGKTFTGSDPSPQVPNYPFSDQNAAKPAIAINPGASNVNINFNEIETRVGAGDAGNSVILVSSQGATITFNNIICHTGGFNGAMNVRGTNAIIRCNRIDLTDNGGGFSYFLQTGGIPPYNNANTVALNNTFLPIGYVDNFSIINQNTGGMQANNGYPAIGCSTLPLKFLGVSAYYKDDKTIAVNWATENETDNGFFTLEYSNDGIFFINEKDQRSKGIGDFIYQQTINPPPAALVYIRIRQTDLDGKFSFSRIVKVEPVKVLQVKVMTNPFSNSIRLEGINGKATAMLYNSAGQLLKQQTVSGYYAVISSGELATGLYFLKLIYDQNEVKTFRLIKN